MGCWIMVKVLQDCRVVTLLAMTTSWLSPQPPQEKPSNNIRGQVLQYHFSFFPSIFLIEMEDTTYFSHTLAFHFTRSSLRTSIYNNTQNIKHPVKKLIRSYRSSAKSYRIIGLAHPPLYITSNKLFTKKMGCVSLFSQGRVTFTNFVILQALTPHLTLFIA